MSTKPDQVTFSSETLLTMDATAIADAIKNAEIFSYDVVSAYIRHAKFVNANINAIVEERFDAALREARDKDNMSESTNKGPLFGVPVSVKEAFDVAGMKTTGGITRRKHLIAREDSDVVSRLKDAGAIVIGKTNTPTLCFCQESVNKLYGRTNNPWDVTRTPGGSSGGEGALLGAGGAAAGIGSDIGGSIRFPSHFNGVVGFKPGKFQVSPVGHFPLNAHPIQDRMAGMGPMGKSVRDIELIYQLIAHHYEKVHTLRDFEISILPGDIQLPLSDETRNILNTLEQVLNQSLPVDRNLPPYFAESAQIWQELMSIDGGKKMAELAFNHDRPNVWTAYGKELLSKNTDIHEFLSWSLIGTKLFQPGTDRVREIEAIVEQGDDTLWDYLSDRLLVFPVYHTGAPEHGKVFQEIFSIRKTFLQYMPYVAYANVWGLPSLTVPVNTDENGLPIAVQIMSRNGNEDVIFQLGKLLEETFRGYVRCTQLDG